MQATTTIPSSWWEPAILFGPGSSPASPGRSKESRREPTPIPPAYPVAWTPEPFPSKYRSLMPSLALISSLIDAVTGGPRGPVSRAAAEQAIAWCGYLEAHARRIYATVTDG